MQQIPIADPSKFAEIDTPKEMWRAIAHFTGYTMATIEQKMREACAKALLVAAENLEIGPNPAWQDVLDNPDFYNEWGEQIKSGEYDDKQIANESAPGVDPEALRNFGVDA